MFKVIGIFVAVYTVYAISLGEVFARSGVWGKTISKTESPTYFWVVIAIYSLLSLALLLIL